MHRRVHIADLCAPDGSTHLLDGRPFTGIAYDLSPEGWLAEELSFENGIQTGPMRSFDRTGRMVDEEYQLAGVSHGPRMAWHENGQLAEEELFEFGTLLEAQYWDASGRLLRSFALDPADPAWDVVQRHRRIMSGDDEPLPPAT